MAAAATDWVGVQSLKQELPGNGAGITEAKLSEYIGDAVSVVTLGDPAAEPTALGKRAVRADAKAQALRHMRDKGDNISLEWIANAREDAERQADLYRASTASVTDDSAGKPKGFIGATPW